MPGQTIAGQGMHSWTAWPWFPLDPPLAHWLLALKEGGDTDNGQLRPRQQATFHKTRIVVQ
jgi:hypothetical protein